MKKKIIMVIMAAVFLNVSGVYADRMVAVGGTVYFDGDGVLGFNGILPQVGWTSATRTEALRIATRLDAEIYDVQEGQWLSRFTGMEFDGFDFSILFDLTLGFSFETHANFSSGLTAEFYFLPFRDGILGAGIGGGWGFVDWIEGVGSQAKDDRPNPYGAPYIRATIPFVIFNGMLKTGVYLDYYLTDDPYIQFNWVALFLL